jgi:hypothetical protein
MLSATVAPTAPAPTTVTFICRFLFREIICAAKIGEKDFLLTGFGIQIIILSSFVNIHKGRFKAQTYGANNLY